MVRNVPQILIQVLYVMEKGNFDIVVLNAMLFSALSALVTILTEIVRYNKNQDNGKRHYQSICHLMTHFRRKTVDDTGQNLYSKWMCEGPYQLKITCDMFHRKHRYTRHAIENIIIQSLLSTGMISRQRSFDIEVFYVINARNSILCFIEIGRDWVVDDLMSVLNDGTSHACVLFKQMVRDQFGFGNNQTQIDVSFVSLQLTSDAFASASSHLQSSLLK